MRLPSLKVFVYYIYKQLHSKTLAKPHITSIFRGYSPVSPVSIPVTCPEVLYAQDTGLRD